MSIDHLPEQPITSPTLNCPACHIKGKPVKSVTIESLVTADARARVNRTEDFRFCASPDCDVAYYRTGTSDIFSRADVTVRIGQKETDPSRHVCYCFNHTAADVEADVIKTGTSAIPDTITEQCRSGLDHCPENNPQGSCCLGNVRAALKEAQTKHNSLEPVNPKKSGVNVGILSQFGAIFTAIIASACCWLPLLLLALGVSGGAMSATFEAWRPVTLPVTFALLGVAFYFTYRKPKALSITTGEGDCCAVGATASDTGESCCATPSKGRVTLKNFNKVMLGGVTVIVLAFAFFPNYIGLVLGGNGELSESQANLDTVVVTIEGMTCAACEISIKSSLQKVPGVSAVAVSYEKKMATIGVPKGVSIPHKEILAAIQQAGNYTGHFEKQVQWTLHITGMT